MERNAHKENELNHNESEHLTLLDRRAQWLVVAQLAALLLMMAVTWRLWFPLANHGDVEFPSLATFQILSNTPTSVNWLNSATLVCGCVVGMVWIMKNSLDSNASRAICSGVVFLLLAECLINQHRFLPWVYQSLLVLSASVILGRIEFLKFARFLVVSIYVFSAISKLDYQFAHTTGRQILFALTDLMGLEVANLPDFWLNLIVLSFPMIELLIGLGLLFTHTRLTAMIVGILMHSTLLLALGPFGLNNAGSVLVWNILFIIQLVLLYWPSRSRSTAANTKSRTSSCYVVMLTILFTVPVLEKFNAVDHWPAWGLYSPRASRCKLWIADWKVDQLPDELKAHCRQTSVKEGMMHEFDLAAWSIERIQTPIYPQDRFQFGIARDLIERQDLNRAFRLEIQSTSHWFSGKRRIISISNIEDLDRASSNFWMYAGE